MRDASLHLGYGKYYWPGWINHDSEVEMDHLPYNDSELERIHAIHLFEHFPRLEAEKYLVEWHRILKLGGELIMEMPSMDKIAQLIVDGETNQRLTLLGIFGDPRDPKPLMMHGWCWGERELRAVLENVGFEVNFTDPVFHMKQRDLRVEAIKHG